MSSRFEYWIGMRYVSSRSKNSFVSLISAISMLGIAIAVSVLIVVLSVVNGFERELKDRLLAMSSHAAIEGVEGQLGNWDELTEFASNDPRVVGAAPYISGQALMIYGEELSGIELRGIDPLHSTLCRRGMHLGAAIGRLGNVDRHWGSPPAFDPASRRAVGSIPPSFGN